jgi:hypothetical protein
MSGNCFLEVISPKYGTIKSQIDADDADKVARFNWTLIFPSKTASDLIYFIADIPREDDPSKTVATRLHIFILGRKPGYIVDHCDPSKTLDNRKSNLRHATGKQNQQNQRRHRDGTSQFKGVSWHGARRKWQAHITVDRKQRYLGTFPRHQEVEAARRYNEAAMEQNDKFGGHFLLNAI